jgi:hypothetical protein
MNDRSALPVRELDDEAAGVRELEQLLYSPIEIREAALTRAQIDGVLVGQLVGFQETYVPLVVFTGQPGSAAIAARTTVDLRGEHIGGEVVLMFEGGDPWRPLVMGRVQKPNAWPLAEKPAQVEVDADGQRLVVSAKEQIVLKCGRASITLTAAGKVMIQGTYVSNRSSGVMRVKGGSVQIN